MKKDERKNLIVDNEYQDKLINPQKIWDLYVNKPKKLQNIFNLYNQTLPPQIEQLACLFEEGDFEKLQKIAHTIKNSFSYLGASSLRPLAMHIENKAMADNTKEEVGLYVREIVSCKKKLEKELKDLMKQYE